MAGKDPLISILTVTYNNAQYMDETISSVLNQEYPHWEWIVVDNGSTDESFKRLNAIQDDRLVLVRLEENLGVSAGRNVALEKMRGDAFCFLDGDDVLPERSISARAQKLFSDDRILFVDGRVETFDHETGKVVDVHIPSFRGLVLPELLRINPAVFKGNTWMIQRDLSRSYRFEPSLTHAEELLFYMDIAGDGWYDFTEESVLLYRRHDGSAMRNIEALDRAYVQLIAHLEKRAYTTIEQVDALDAQIRWMMVKTYLKQRRPIRAIQRWFQK
jgi:glycosyltransferase involved in cell wall biosynthesis